MWSFQGRYHILHLTWFALFLTFVNWFNYGIVPLIKKEITGQIAGNVRAYGNFLGGVFLTVYRFANPPALFATMGIAALVYASLCACFLREPQASFTDDYHQTSSEVSLVVFRQENFDGSKTLKI